MKIEFNGRVILGFVLGGICGAIATVVAVANGPMKWKDMELRDRVFHAFTGDYQAEVPTHIRSLTATDFIDKVGQQYRGVKADDERVGLQMGQAYAELQLLKEHCYGRNATPAAVPPSQAPQSQDPAVQVLNMVRPGLGTAVGALANAAQNAQAAKAAAPQAAPAQRSLIVTAFSDACGPNGFLINGECSTCNPGLHPGTFPDGSVGCVQ